MGNKMEKEDANANGNGGVLKKLLGKVPLPSRESDCAAKNI